MSMQTCLDSTPTFTDYVFPQRVIQLESATFDVCWTKFQRKQVSDWISVRDVSSPHSSGDQQQNIKSFLFYCVSFYNQAKMSAYINLQSKDDIQSSWSFITEEELNPLWNTCESEKIYSGTYFVIQIQIEYDIRQIHWLLWLFPLTTLRCQFWNWLPEIVI